MRKDKSVTEVALVTDRGYHSDGPRLDRPYLDVGSPLPSSYIKVRVM
ncbi:MULTISPECIES: hypothetical protein [Bacteroides]|nr:hypothetical protein [Bacteroides neonati]